jgi:hypothetical protein
MINASATDALADPLRRAIRPVTILAWSQLAGLLVTLAAEEFLRIQFRPFLGFAQLTNRPAIRYGFYLAAAAVIIVIRVLNAVGFRRKKTDRPEALLGRLRAVALLTLAAAEIPTLLGLALFLLGGYNVDFYMLTFVSLVLIFMYFPRPRVWETRLHDSPTACPF